jgi:hypothetical protein
MVPMTSSTRQVSATKRQPTVRRQRRVIGAELDSRPAGRYGDHQTGAFPVREGVIRAGHRFRGLGLDVGVAGRGQGVLYGGRAYPGEESRS